MSEGDAFDPKMLEALFCPLTHGPLEINATRDGLVSRSARLIYPIRSGIPILLEDEAKPLPDTEKGG